jgi:tripartite-type tricarboxylate transporter receptor subunit TctC
LAYVKANKGKISYGSWGVGSYAHLGGSYMSKTMDADMVHSAYKGESPMIQDLIGGQIQICFSSALNTKNSIEAGRINVIGVTGKKRLPVLPNVPTIYEQGVQDKTYSLYGWLGMGAPSGLPKQVADSLGFHLSEIAKDPKVQKRIKNAGLLPMINSAQEFEKNYREELPVWKSLVETAGAKLD